MEKAFAAEFITKLENNKYHTTSSNNDLNINQVIP